MESKIVYVHSKTENGRRFTVAGVSLMEGIKLGFAICHPKDQFCRRIGREIAAGRALWKPEQVLKSNEPVKQAVYTLAEFIKKHWDYPYHTKI